MTEETKKPNFIKCIDAAKHEGETVIIKCLITSIEYKKASNGSLFANCKLQDDTGKVSAKRWDCDKFEGRVSREDQNLYAITDGDVVNVKGKMEIFNGKPQLVIVGMNHTTGESSDFVKCSTKSIPFLNMEFETLTDYLEGPFLKVVKAIFGSDKFKEKFFSAPAAVGHHHSFTRGLAEHTFSMCKIAEDVCGHYENYYPDLNIDKNLVICGVILHDVGKVFDMEFLNGEWVTTKKMSMLGHIANGTLFVYEACKRVELTEKDRDLLLHVILSHHGTNAFGSPVVPSTIEALIVHQIDSMDSRVGMFRTSVEILSDGEQSNSYSRTLGGWMIKSEPSKESQSKREIEAERERIYQDETNGSKPTDWSLDESKNPVTKGENNV